MPKLHQIVLSFILVLMSACSILGEQDEHDSWSAQRYYDEAKESMKVGDYQTAISHLEDLEIRFPFSPHTAQGQLDIAYAYYQYDEPDSAIAAADRFIKLYPRHQNIDYAYYIKGLSNFNRGFTGLDFLFNVDLSKQDPQSGLESFRDFEQLIKHYPDSIYVDDAKQRMVYLNNKLAAYEINVADHYMRRGAYLAAANRAQYVLESYPQAQATSQALVLMAKAYEQLGLDDLKADTLSIIEKNTAVTSDQNNKESKDVGLF